MRFNRFKKLSDAQTAEPFRNTQGSLMLIRKSAGKFDGQFSPSFLARFQSFVELFRIILIAVSAGNLWNVPFILGVFRCQYRLTSKAERFVRGFERRID